MRVLALVFLTLAFPGALQASTAGDEKVLAMLHSNSIVQAAVAQAKEFSGANSCDYKVQTSEAENFQPGTTFDYTAEISCASPPDQEDEAGAVIRVSGTMLEGGPQDLKLDIGFAG